MNFLFIILLALVESILATEASAPLSAKDLYKKYKPAIVKIDIDQQGVAVSFGSGFFISPHGHLITNRHVVNQIFTSGYGVEIVLADGRKFRNYEVGGCSDKRGIDLCLLKLAIESPSYVEAPLKNLEVGEDVFVLGHPKGFEFSLTNGMISGIREEKSRIPTQKTFSQDGNIQMVQISAPVSNGNSGGPVLNNKGQLVGVATLIRVDTGAQNLNFAISGAEAFAYFNAHSKTVPFSEYRKNYQNNLEVMAKIARDFIFGPAYDSIDKNGTVDPKQFVPVTLTYGDFKMQTKILKDFLSPELGGIGGKCSTKEESNSFRLNCIGGGSFADGMLEIMIQKSTPLALSEISKKLPPLIPLPIVTTLMANGQWEKVKKTLNAKQLKFLYSVPSKWKCKNYKPKNARALISDALVCSTHVYNAGAPDASSLFVVVQQKNSPYLIYFSGNAFQSAYSLPYYDMANYMMLTATDMSPTRTVAEEKRANDQGLTRPPLERNRLLESVKKAREGK